MGLPDDKSLGADSAVAVTKLLRAAGAGDCGASARLLPLVYEQLRKLAKSQMRQERGGQTLQATALVHEAYLRLVDQTAVRDWDGRGHFFAAAAEAMRRILVDNARRRSRAKRGGGIHRISLDENHLTVNEPPDDILALDEALDELKQKHPDKAELVKLRYFAGLTIAEAAAALGIATSTADRHWAFARAWLYRRMGGVQVASSLPSPHNVFSGRVSISTELYNGFGMKSEETIFSQALLKSSAEERAAQSLGRVPASLAKPVRGHVRSNSTAALPLLPARSNTEKAFMYAATRAKSRTEVRSESSGSAKLDMSDRVMVQIIAREAERTIAEHEPTTLPASTRPTATTSPADELSTAN